MKVESGPDGEVVRLMNSYLVSLIFFLEPVGAGGLLYESSFGIKVVFFSRQASTLFPLLCLSLPLSDRRRSHFENK